MKSKSIFLLGIIIISMFPQNIIQAEEKITRTFSSALDFLYLSDAILLNQVEDDETSSISALMSPTIPSPTLDIKTDLINQMINAVKNQRNDHFKKCTETVNLYREQGKTCEADKAEAYCKTKYQQLTDKISSLRILRGGDRRNFFTKTWHSIKRSGAKIWHRIGPLARKVLREVGPQALQIVSTGGAGSHAALRQLFKHTVKKIGREHLKEIAFKGIQRILKVQIDVATAAGIDICDPEKEQTQEDSEQPKVENKTGNELKLPDTGVWNLRCQDTDEFRDKYYQTVVWNVTIDWKARAFTGIIEAQGDQISVTEGAYGAPDIVDKIHLDWKEEGSGSVTEDGFFWGEFSQVITSTNTHQEVVTGSYTQEYTENWIGAISENLDQVCFSRVGARDWFTLDWIRERGRQEMLDNPGGFCEALCYVK